MNKLRLVQLLESVLSKGDFNQQSNEITFHCPFCKHDHKKKLNVNLISEKWHCWVCGVGGHKVFALFKRLRVAQVFFNTLSKITGNNNSTVKYDKEYEMVLLPTEFKSLSESTPPNPESRNALSYLLNRGLTSQDILKYNIGYCSSGKYKGMIIIPSYDEDGTLNFFTGRSYYNVKFKHLNPTVSKDIIGFDLFINWDLPITIVEGAFDAIAVKRNAIPLFGKQILDKLKIKILEKGVKRVNVALDRDAMKNAISMADYFNSNGITVYFVELPETDPSELGFLGITELIQRVEKLTPQKLLEYKIHAY